MQPVTARGIDLSVVIVSWNVAELLRRCLLSVEQELRGLSSEVFVVDNASSDDSVPMVREHFPWVRLIANAHNPGFSVANNQAIRGAGGRVLILLNPDTEVRPGGLTRLVRFLDQHPGVGAVGPKLLYPDGRIQKECARTIPALTDDVYQAFGVTALVHPYRLPGHSSMGWWDHLDSRPVETLLGACMAVRRDVVERVGLLDERYTHGGEDIDWCCRIRTAGWQVYYLAAAEVVHHYHASTRKARPQTMLRAIRSNHLFYQRHHGPVYAALYAALIRMVLVPRLVITSVAGLATGRFTPQQASQRLNTAARLLSAV